MAAPRSRFGTLLGASVLALAAGCSNPDRLIEFERDSWSLEVAAIPDSALARVSCPDTVEAGVEFKVWTPTLLVNCDRQGPDSVRWISPLEVEIVPRDSIYSGSEFCAAVGRIDNHRVSLTFTVPGSATLEVTRRSATPEVTRRSATLEQRTLRRAGGDSIHRVKRTIIVR